MAKRIHIVIVESSAIVRSGLMALLQGDDSISCDVALLSDVAMVSSAHTAKTPDLLIVNPTLLGQASLSQFRADLGNEALKVMALQSAFVDQLLLQNFDDVISIYDTPETIVQKITAVSSSADDAVERKELSAREKEIIVCVVKGLTNKQIADELFLSTHTVIAHRRNIASKLQIHSPSGLTIYAIVNKLVDLTDIKNNSDKKFGA